EIRQSDPFNIKDQVFATAHPYKQVGEQVVGLRDVQSHGFLTDMGPIQSMQLTVVGYDGFDQTKIKQILADRFYAGKIDLNQAGEKEIEYALSRIDPLAVGGNSDVYVKAAKAITDYRRNRSGVINDLSEIQLQDVSPNLHEKMVPYFTEGSFAVISADVVGA